MAGLLESLPQAAVSASEHGGQAGRDPESYKLRLVMFVYLLSLMSLPPVRVSFAVTLIKIP